jgi:asparagine synthase (glutamine-hydrolysing)
MCGICGAIGIESKEVSEAAVRRMMAAMVHRGPDEDGILVSPPVSVGMRRLSIVDLPGGSQPVWNETGTVAVVFNGEIYNFRKLRAELESRGHKFRTQSDTETIVHAYEEWGEQCPARLHGMFAFAVVEMPQGAAGRATRVFIARDPLGIKPLYYSVADGAFLFASEVRVLLASGRIAARLCTEAVSAYLLFGSVCEPTTLVEGIISLPPGHSLSIPTDGPIPAVEPKCHWHPRRDAEKTDAKSGNPDDHTSPAQKIRSLLEDAVSKHLVADVPIGVFLSSGLDSTALAALASCTHAGIHTFTVAFPDAKFSEANVARRTANRLGTDHRELNISDQEMVARLDEAVAAFDQPSMDGVNTFFVSWAARQAGLKVALSGLGSDEIFGGYQSYRKTQSVARASGFARFAPRSLRAALAGSLAGGAGAITSPDAARKAFAAFLDPDALPHPYLYTRLLFTPQVIATQLEGDPANWKQLAWWQWFAEASNQSRLMDDFSGVCWIESRSYLANTLLRDTDAMSMRHSLEVRVPFLDLRLFEYILALPESQKRGSARPKELLISALGDLIPEEVVTQKKRTFTFPWENWLRGALGKRVAVGLSDWPEILESQIPRRFALSTWNDFLAGRTSWSRPWSLYVLGEWVKRNLRADADDSGPDRKKVATVSIV